MAHLILAETIANVSELKRDPIGTVAAGGGFAVAILHRNQPAFYCVPAEAYETLMDRLDDVDLTAIADLRAGQPINRIALEELDADYSRPR